jgi:hypothetical protein
MMKKNAQMKKIINRKGVRECIAIVFFFTKPLLTKMFPFCLFLSLTFPVVTLSPAFIA